jgi:hypothetical protein
VILITGLTESFWIFLYATNIKLPLIKVTGINTFNKTLSGLTRLVLQPMLNIYLTFNFLSILPPVSFKLELETRTVCSQHHILLYPYKKIQKLSVSPVIRITQQNYIHLWLSDIITYGGNHVILDTTLCDKICQWFAAGQWFSPGTPVSSHNKTDLYDITEILLKVVLNTINTHCHTMEF